MSGDLWNESRHFIEIRNNRSVYKLVFERNLSVITGESATGKTTLINLIRSFDQYGPDSEIEKILAAPYDYIDSSQFFSWENYFTALLVEKTKDSYLRYSKSVLNDAYLQEHEKLAILSVLPDVISEFFKGPGRK